MSDTRLLILSRDEAHYRRLLQKEALPGLTLLGRPGEAPTTELVAQAQVLLGEPATLAPWLKEAKRLQWAQSTYAGVDALLQPGLRQDYLLTNIREIFGPLMSEYVFAHLLSLTRHLPLYREQQKQGQWQAAPYQGLAGRQMLILGTGSIGQHLARTAQHFGMQVKGVNRSGREVAGFAATYQPSALPRLLAKSDVIVSVLPSTPQTRHLLTPELLSHCQRGAILFNVGRGDLIASDVLISALRQGLLGAAVVDVFEEEPLPAKSPLWHQPNLIITPHNAAWSLPDQVTRIFARNYRLWRAQAPLEYQVDFRRGY